MLDTQKEKFNVFRIVNVWRNSLTPVQRKPFSGIMNTSSSILVPFHKSINRQGPSFYVPSMRLKEAHKNISLGILLEQDFFTQIGNKTDKVSLETVKSPIMNIRNLGQLTNSTTNSKLK